jgi:hypothetical protein
MWLFTHDAHAFRMMLGYFAYAGGAFAVITALSYYHGKFADAVKAKGEQRITLRRIGEFRLMRAATFEPAERRPDEGSRPPMIAIRWRASAPQSDIPPSGQPGPPASYPKTDGLATASEDQDMTVASRSFGDAQRGDL